MDIHEYQAKEILAKYGVKIAEGGLAYSPEESVQRAREIDGNVWVVKARSIRERAVKPAASRFAKSHDEVKAAAEELIGKKFDYSSNRAGRQGLVQGYISKQGRILLKKCISAF